MKSNHSLKFMFLASLTCTVFMYSGCGSNPQQIDNSFATLCTLSGGVISADGQSCMCGTDSEQICPNGSVCDYKDPEECAVKEGVKCLTIGKRKCKNGNVKYCSEERVWKDEAQGCGVKGCNSAADGCKDECADGESKCSDNKALLFTCSVAGDSGAEYKYTQAMDCAQGCFTTHENRDYCIECEDDAVRCHDNKSQKCVSGRWQALYDYCIECEDGATRCRPNENHPETGVPQTCVKGHWVYSKAGCSGSEGDDDKCSCNNNVSCTITASAEGTVESSACGECMDGSVECFDYDNKGYQISCRNGSFKPGEESVKKCSDGSCSLENGIQACASDVSCAYKHHQCLNNAGCECGSSSCSFGDYCADGACVKKSDVESTTREEWVCGDCQNNPSLDVSLNHCGSNLGANDCHSAALSNIPLSITQTCMESASIDKCLQSIFDVSCMLSSCQRFRSMASCDSLADTCWSYHLQYQECGISKESAYYFKKNYVPCTDESCACGTQTCQNGQICWEDKACYDKDGINVKACRDESCACGENSCAKDQYCVDDQKCVDNVVDVGKKIECGNAETCSFCQNNNCECGIGVCGKNQYCIVSGSGYKCKSVSEMNVVNANLCKAESCRCGDSIPCRAGQYCVDDSRCVDTISDSDALYEFVNSHYHVCSHFVSHCDDNLTELNTCIEKGNGNYKTCMNQCEQNKCGDACGQMDCKTECESCKTACSNAHTEASQACMHDVMAEDSDVNKVLERFIEGATCSPSESATPSICQYSCTSGRYMPFNASTSCN